jgi:hypothetical protein
MSLVYVHLPYIKDYSIVKNTYIYIYMHIYLHMYSSFTRNVGESGSALKLIHHLSSHMSSPIQFVSWPHTGAWRSVRSDWKWIIACLDYYLFYVYSTGAYNLCVWDCTLLSLSIVPPSFSFSTTTIIIH